MKRKAGLVIAGLVLIEVGLFIGHTIVQMDPYAAMKICNSMGFCVGGCFVMASAFKP